MVDLLVDDVIVEVEWFMVLFGQILVNGLGELKMMELCEMVKVVLGLCFDLCCFYEEILCDGFMLLDIFDVKIVCWIVSEQVGGSVSFMF